MVSSVPGFEAGVDTHPPSLISQVRRGKINKLLARGHASMEGKHIEKRLMTALWKHTVCGWMYLCDVNENEASESGTMTASKTNSLESSSLI